MDGPSKGKQPVRYDLPDVLLDIPPSPLLGGHWLTGLDVTEVLRALTIDDDPIPRDISPTMPTFASIHEPRRSRQHSGDMIRTLRPKLRRKAATAPPGALNLFSTIPQPLRRAISARVNQPGQGRGKVGRQSDLWSAPLPRISVRGARASRSLISRRKSNRKYVGRLGLKPRHSVWRVPQPSTSKRYQLILEASDHEENTLREEAQMKERLKPKKVECLHTNIVDFGAIDLPDTPGSMSSTPREMYGSPAEGFSFTSHPEMGKRRLLPTNRAKHFSLPLSPDIQRCEFIVRSDPELTTRTTTQGGINKQQIYVPGPIRLEEKISVTSRKGSIATLESFTGEREEEGKRYSDQVASDSVVAYFHSLVVLNEAGEDGLDKFWEPEMKTSSTVATGAPPVPIRPPPLAIPSTIISPVRVVQQQENRQRLPSPNLRQRIKLRRFLNSATSML